MKRYQLRITLLSVMLGLAAARLPALPSRPRQVRAIRTSHLIRIDGLLTEKTWQSGGVSGFTQSDPRDGAPATRDTRVWIAYDADHLYLAARLHDPDPGGIISRLGRRDEELESDWFYFSIDPYLDKTSGFIFGINPSGAILDGTLFNDEERDLTWDGIWDAAARITPEGWQLEMKIPFSQLRFKRDDRYIWGVNFTRFIQRIHERSTFSWVPKEEAGFVSRFARLSGIQEIAPPRLLELLPYAAGNAALRPSSADDSPVHQREFFGNTGFDFRGGLKSNLTLNLTVNPDFGQVEVDPAVINISDQETYYREKRPFFIEGADIFRFGAGGANVTRDIGWQNPIFFYSRRIGRAPQVPPAGGGGIDSPDWTRILGAVKVSGKMGRGWSLGLLGALTDRENIPVSEDGETRNRELEPLSLYGVVRLKKEFQRGKHGLGVMATSVNRWIQTPETADYLPRRALSFALDGWTTLDRDGAWVLNGWAGSSLVRGEAAAITRLQRSPLHYFQRPDVPYVGVDEGATSLKGMAGRLFLNKQKGRFIFNSALGFVTPGFNVADVGYQTRGDRIHGHMEIGYQSFHPGRIFRRWRGTLSGCRGYDFGGNRINEEYACTLSGRFLNYWDAALYFSYDPTRRNHDLTRGGPRSEYPWGFTQSLSLNSDSRRKMVLSLSAYHRQHPYNAYNYSLSLGLRWKPAGNLSLEVIPGYAWRHSAGQWITSVPDPLKTETFQVRYLFSDIIVETVPLEIRLNWTFSPRLSLQAYLQPYLGAGDYFNFKEWRKPGTFEFTPFGQGGSTLRLENGLYTLDPDGPGPAPPIPVADPDFNLKSLRGTVVLRWEYRPGSVLHLVWTQNRSDYSHPGDLDFCRDVKTLLSARGDHLFMIKISYRFDI